MKRFLPFVFAVVTGVIFSIIISSVSPKPTALAQSITSGDLLAELRAPQNMAAITPSDSTDLPDGPAKYIYVDGSTGNIKVTTVGGQTVTLTAVASKTFLHLAVKRVFATGTTATTLYAVF